MHIYNISMIMNKFLNFNTITKFISLMGILFIIFNYMVNPVLKIVSINTEVEYIILGALSIMACVVAAHAHHNDRIIEFFSLDNKIVIKKIFTNPGVVAFLSTFLNQFQNENNILECLKPAVIAGLLALVASYNNGE